MKMVVLSPWALMIACILQSAVLVVPSNYNSHSQCGTSRTSHEISPEDCDISHRRIPSERLFDNFTANRLLDLYGGKQSSFIGQFMNLASSFISRWLPLSWTKSKDDGANKSRYGTKRTAKENKKAQQSTIHSDASNRLQKEMKSFLDNPPDNCQLSVGKNIRSWTITLTGVNGTIFAGESYKLRMNFPRDYPSKPPSVFFLKPCPKHMHVYTNGDICLNFLGKDWRPTITAETLAVSILSMLSSAKEKSIPQDNALHADSQPGKQQDNWMYHDDRC